MKNEKWTLGENEPKRTQSCPEQGRRACGELVEPILPRGITGGEGIKRL